MGGGLWLFRQDLNNTIQLLEEKPIGQIYWNYNTTQRLSARHLQWGRIERFSPVYNGDTVKTASLSSLKINFSGGETLELSENTTVRIQYRNEEENYFELLGGEIQIQTNRLGIEISVTENAAENVPPNAAQTIDLEPRTNASVKARDGCTVKVFQGAGTLSSAGESHSIREGNSIVTGNDGAILSVPPLMVLSPRNGARLLRTSRGKAPVKFIWQKSDAASAVPAPAEAPSAGEQAPGDTASSEPQENGGVWLEIAETRDFSRLVGSWYSKDENSREIDLDEGTYYWKIYISQTQEEVDSGRLDIIYTPGPRALSPANGSVQTLRQGKQDLRFYWSVPEEAEAVLLEVAANQDMARPRLRQLIRGNTGGSGSYTASDLAPGKWYWRVNPVYPGGVTEGDNLASQDSGSQSFWRLRPVNADVMAEDSPSPVNSFTLAEASTPPAPVQRDSPIARNDEPGNTPRLLFPADNYTLEAGRTPDLFFSWKNPLSYKARFQIAHRSDFSDSLIVDEDVFGSNIQSIFLSPGTYYWHIINAEKNANGGSTIPTRLVITPSLAAPELRSPRENERLLIAEGKPVIFSWERTSYASYYTFNLFLEDRDIPLTEIASLQNNSVQVYFDPTTAGRFRWTVQGFASPTDTSSGRNGLIAQGRFTITPQENSAQNGEVKWRIPRITNIETYSGEVRSPITLVSPAKGVSMAGLQALRSPPVARWRSQDPLRNVQLIVSHSSDPSSDPRAIVKDAGATSVNFPSLGEGIWYWIIRGDTSTGRGATPGDPFWFTVLPIPQLPAPEIIAPEDESAIGIAQLTRDRDIVFRWNESEEANAYIFSLFRGGDPPALLVATNPDAALSYTFTNLTLLSEGNYQWQVEAVSLNANGEIEQRGVIEQHKFSIDIQRSTDLQTRSQGTMYGQ